LLPPRWFVSAGRCVEFELIVLSVFRLNADLAFIAIANVAGN
jgi:hypothetical protein